jgi:hypothetical protein
LLSHAVHLPETHLSSKTAPDTFEWTQSPAGHTFVRADSLCAWIYHWLRLDLCSCAERQIFKKIFSLSRELEQCRIEVEIAGESAAFRSRSIAIGTRRTYCGAAPIASSIAIELFEGSYRKSIVERELGESIA